MMPWIVEHPVWFLLLLAAIPSALIALRWFSTMSRVRRASAVLFRVLLIALIAGVLAGVQTVRTTERLAVIALVDVSGSVRRFSEPMTDEQGEPLSPVEAARRFLEQASKERGPDDLLGVVAFDGQAIAIATPTRGDAADRSIDVRSADGTNIADAIRLGGAMIPPDANARLLLISDGVETSGDALDEARRLTLRTAGTMSDGQGVPIDVVPIAYNVDNEVLVRSVDAPPTSPSEAVVTVRVTLEATSPTTGTLRLLVEGEPVDISPNSEGMGRRLALEPGQTTELIDLKLEPRRVHRYEAIFEPDTVVGKDGTPVLVGDTQVANNRGEAFTITPGKGSVLLVDGANNASRTAPLPSTLTRAGIDVEVIDPSAFPSDLLALQAYDLVMLQNVSADALPSHDMLVAHVRDLAGGLVMIGGPDSFGAGGWQGTSIEPILPVKLDLPEDLVVPEAAVVFVIDKSGSMGRSIQGSPRSQQQVANEATALAIRTLDKEDMVGVIAFSRDVDVVLPLAKNTNQDASVRKVESIGSGGGTNIGPALEEARRQLEAVDARIKHVILLSDGRSLNPDSLPPLAQRMNDEGIRVTSIAIGSAIADDTMRLVADRGGGAFYNVYDPTLLPRIFVKAVRIVRKPLVRETPFDPVLVNTGSPLTVGLSDPPRLGGLVLTAPRDEPTITYPMLAPEGEPLLAHWNVELGQVVAFTSDADRWARRWLDWPGYELFWTQIARSTARAPSARRYDHSARIDNDRFEVTLDAFDDYGAPLDLLSVPATVYTPSGEQIESRLEQVGPGLYRASTPARESGSYIAVLRPSLGNNRLAPVITGASMSGGPEYRVLRSDVARLRRIADATGGRVLDLSDPGGTALFDRSGLEPRRAAAPMWRSLLLWAVLVLLLDVGTRRVAWDRFVSREFGVDLHKAAVESARERTSEAAATVEGLRAKPRPGGSGLARAGALGDDDASRLAREQAEARQRRRMEELKAMREARRAASSDTGTTPDAPDPSGPDAAADEPSSGLLEAKRRARQRFTEEQDES